MEIADRYSLRLSDEARELLSKETPKALDNIETYITGSVKELVAAAANSCRRLGYEPIILTDRLSCEAKEAGRFLGSILKAVEDSEARMEDIINTASTTILDEPTHVELKRPLPSNLAFIAGGETVVHLKGHGLGGRNQELALSAAKEIAGLPNVAVFSVGSDGTDGPTDAAGGYVDGDTMEALNMAGISIDKALEDNDSYNALNAVGGLIITGATGTNVNDVSVALINNGDK